MGATKLLAEVIIQRHAADAVRQGCSTQFACVRFGNVLGSRGSVLPIFLKQIAAGGPITVTHAEMTRYFMTIPQAVRLVLQAATLASTGDVYMLDMGNPVRIMDFAREVIESCGLVPEKDIQIQVVGTRPGEKLHEQLWNEDAHVTPTTFSQVFRVHATKVDRRFPILLAKLELAAYERNSASVRALLHELPIEYLTAEPESAAPIAAAVDHRFEPLYLGDLDAVAVPVS
jgi:FlaA1/EpsC-like NDP-sugar epimerase